MTEFAQELNDKLTRLCWLLHVQQTRSYAESSPVSDPSRGQGRILALLKMKDGISTKDLSFLLGIRTSSLNETLSKLEKGGYILREPSEADRRVMLVMLTDKGRAAEQTGDEVPDMFSVLDETEQANFSEYLDRIIEALENELGFDEVTNFERMQRAREHMGNELFSRFAEGMGGFNRMRGGGWPDIDPRRADFGRGRTRQ